MKDKSLIKQIKRVPIFFLLLILATFVIKVYSDLTSIGDVRVLEVRTNVLEEKTYHRVEVGENSFTTGIDGTLHWKVNHLKEAFLVGLADGDRLVSYYDILYFLLLDVALFYMVSKMNEGTVFSQQVALGFKTVLYCLVSYPLVPLIDNHFSGECIKELTGYKFTSQFLAFGIGKFQLIIYLVIFLYPFLRKAVKTEEENELTV